MMNQLVFHVQKIIPVTSIQDLNPRPCADNSHTSFLPFEMTVIEPGDGDIPTRKLNWKPFGWLSHIMCRTIDDHFPLTLWEVWFCSSLCNPIPAFIGPSQ
jgi:hypothetical protein